MRTKPLGRDAVLEFLRDVYMQRHALYTQTINKIIKDHNLPRGFVYYLLHHSPIIKPIFVKGNTNRITRYMWNALNTDKKDIIPSLVMADRSITEYTSYVTTEQQRVKESQEE